MVIIMVIFRSIFLIVCFVFLLKLYSYGLSLLLASKAVYSFKLKILDMLRVRSKLGKFLAVLWFLFFCLLHFMAIGIALFIATSFTEYLFFL